MDKRVFTAFIFFVALGSIFAGCGGDESSSDQTVHASSLTKARYLKKANELCIKMNSERFAAVEDAAREKEAQQSPIGNADLERLTTEVMLPRISSLSQELAELGAPKGDEQTIEGILKKLDASVAAGEAEPKRFVDGGLFSPVDDAFANYGLIGCRF